MPLIILEGIDGSGKSTQTELLIKYLDSKGTDYRRLRFPNYGTPGCSLVEMYLSGEFGSSPGDVNPYAASSFYAMDRYASYKKNWEKDYAAGRLIISDRYVTSNMVHQAAKLLPSERAGFIRWLKEYEYGLLGLPQPDAVVYFNMPPSLCAEHIASRKTGRDIHENDIGFLEESAKAALLAADMDGWNMIECAENGRAKPIGIIHEMVLAALRPYII